MRDSNWDLDYRAGLEGESKVADLLHLDTVEVKTDKKWVKTGNLYIETECYYQNEQAWKSSGIRVSQATHWGFVLEDSVLIVPLHRLKEVIWEVGRPITCDIQPNPSRGYLVTPAVILEHMRTARTKEIAAYEAYENYNSEQDKITETIY